MVLKGQFLERPTVIVSEGQYLEGLSHRGQVAPALLICSPHPLQGGSMDAPICAELAFAASQAGHATLRFNYRGAGASQGTLSGEHAATVADARAAMELLLQNVPHRAVVAAGYGYGAEVAIELALSGAPLAGVVVIAPETSRYDYARLGKVTVPGLIVVPGEDTSVDRHALAAHCQSTGDQLVVIPEADRVFTSGLPAAGKAVVEFLKGATGGLSSPGSTEPIDLA
ncbi:MAG: alpha/beta hydrolase [Myxococcales bacterium]